MWRGVAVTAVRVQAAAAGAAAAAAPRQRHAVSAAAATLPRCFHSSRTTADNDGAGGVSGGTRKPATTFTFDELVARRREGRVKKSLIYTRTGDKGSSALFSGERRSKADLFFHAIGTADELNTVVGVAREYCLLAGNGLDVLLADIQSRLLDVGAAIATPRDKSSEEKKAKTVLPAECTMQLECAIDELDSRLPKLKTFILPSGGLAASHLHMARVVCRRAERTTIPLLQEGHVDPEVGRYLNRLSDFFFASARYAAHFEGIKESEWIHRTDS